MAAKRSGVLYTPRETTYEIVSWPTCVGVCVALILGIAGTVTGTWAVLHTSAPSPPLAPAPPLPLPFTPPPVDTHCVNLEYHNNSNDDNFALQYSSEGTCKYDDYIPSTCKELYKHWPDCSGRRLEEASDGTSPPQLQYKVRYYTDAIQRQKNWINGLPSCTDYTSLNAQRGPVACRCNTTDATARRHYLSWVNPSYHCGAGNNDIICEDWTLLNEYNMEGGWSDSPRPIVLYELLHRHAFERWTFEHSATTVFVCGRPHIKTFRQAPSNDDPLSWNPFGWSVFP